MFKKRKRRGTSRVRNSKVIDNDDDDADGVIDDDESVAVADIRACHQQRHRSKYDSNPLVQHSQKRKMNLGLQVDSSKSAAPAGPSDQGASMLIAVDVKKQIDTSEKKDSTGRSLYKGNASYEQKRGGQGKYGPIRQPSNVRLSCRFDYQPDICKDYKETGYCGYGDSCKFMHDRSDFKSGWQMEREWNVEQAKKNKKLLGGEISDEENYEIGSDDEEFPFACFICRDSFTKPVITKCNHYFCESCALKRYATSSRCAVCKQQTMGIFNTATNLIKRIKAASVDVNVDNNNDDTQDYNESNDTNH